MRAVQGTSGYGGMGWWGGVPSHSAMPTAQSVRSLRWNRIGVPCCNIVRSNQPPHRPPPFISDTILWLLRPRDHQNRLGSAMSWEFQWCQRLKVVQCDIGPPPMGSRHDYVKIKGVLYCYRHRCSVLQGKWKIFGRSDEFLDEMMNLMPHETWHISFYWEWNLHIGTYGEHVKRLDGLERYLNLLHLWMEPNQTKVINRAKSDCWFNIADLSHES